MPARDGAEDGAEGAGGARAGAGPDGSGDGAPGGAGDGAPGGPGAADADGDGTGAEREFADGTALRPLLQPRGIAIVGASGERGKFSSRLIPSLRACGYRGGLYPVNPRYDELDGLPCYPSLGAVPSPCDLAIVAVPARHVVGVVAEAAQRGVGAAVILSSGFEEVGPAGAARAAELRAAAGPVRLYGPNCPGLWQVRAGLVYTFSAQFTPGMLRPGPVGLVTQGGALGRTVLDAMPAGVGFSYWFSTGNEADLDAADFVSFLADDPGTRTVALVLEGWRDGRRFLRAVARCRAAGKPVLVLKIGRTAVGGAAAHAHTGAVNGSGAVAAEALRRAGCVCPRDLDELIHLLQLVARHPAPGPGGLGICTFSGGAGGLLADLATEEGLDVPALSAASAAALRQLLPDLAAVGNPTDLTTAVLADPALARRALEVMAADPALAAVLFPLPHRHDDFDRAVAPHLCAVAAAADKPVGVVALSPQFPEEAAADLLRQGGVTVFPSAHQAVRAMGAWLRLRRLPPACAPPPCPSGATAGAPPAPDWEGWGVLDAQRAWADTADGALALAAPWGFPVACGGAGGAPPVLAWDGAGLRAAWEAAARAGGAVWVAPAAPPGPRLRCAAFWDASFGPVVACGLGGRAGLGREREPDERPDRSSRLAPLGEAEARAMLAELWGPPGPAEALGLEAVARALVGLGHWVSAAGRGAAREAELGLRADGRAVLVPPAGGDPGTGFREGR